jgi:hypothetical protein
MGKLKDQLAGVAALVAAIIAIGGGFIKYGEITTKLDALQKASVAVDEVSIEMVTANQKDIEFLKSKKDIDISDLEEAMAYNKTQTMVLSKEIELLKIQIEEIKVSTSNPLTN